MMPPPHRRSMFELHLISDGQVIAVHAIDLKPTYIGRSSRNDLVCVDDTVSGRHLSIWRANEAVFLEDLGSRNGTLVNGERVRGTQQVGPGDVVRLGALELRVAPAPASAAPGAEIMQLEDVEAGVRYPFTGDRLHIGSGRDCDLVLADAPQEAAVLLRDADGDVHLGVDDDLTELRLDTPFVVGGRTFALRRAVEVHAATRELRAQSFAYELHAALSGPHGLHAEVRDPHSGARCSPDGEHRRVVLYLLGKQLVEHAAQGIDPEEAGWISEEDLAIGIWGRNERHRNVNVLLCRLRKELRAEGFDPWFIEKKRGMVRARLTVAQLG
jgi:hypothetical protein